jgi:hypothetical protein
VLNSAIPMIVNPLTYGSIMTPTDIGSGGGGSYGAYGGGALLLTVQGTTTVASAGFISANAGGGAYSAGSGGSVYLTTGWLAGGGTIRANGGGAGVAGAAGGGGRVAIILTGLGADFSSWTGAGGSHTAYGGIGSSSYPAAAAGTVYRQAAGIPAGAGTVIVDNRNTATNVTFTSLPAFTNSIELLKYSQWITQNKARLMLVTNTTIGGLTMTTNSYLELAGFNLNLDALSITGKVYPAGSYLAANLGALVSDSSGGNGRVVVAARGTVLVVY